MTVLTSLGEVGIIAYDRGIEPDLDFNQAWMYYKIFTGNQIPGVDPQSYPSNNIICKENVDVFFIVQRGITHDYAAINKLVKNIESTLPKNDYINVKGFRYGVMSFGLSYESVLNYDISNWGNENSPFIDIFLPDSIPTGATATENYLGDAIAKWHDVFSDYKQKLVDEEDVNQKIKIILLTDKVRDAGNSISQVIENFKAEPYGRFEFFWLGWDWDVDLLEQFRQPYFTTEKSNIFYTEKFNENNALEDYLLEVLQESCGYKRGLRTFPKS